MDVPERSRGFNVRLINKVGISLATGALTGGVIYGLESQVITDPEEFNARVAACAAQLGPIATDRATVPPACTEFSYHFAYTETMRYTIDPQQQRLVRTSNSRVYNLPSGADFSREEIITPAEDEENRQVASKMVGFAAGFATIAMFGASLIMDRRPRREYQDKVEEDQPPAKPV